MKKKIIAAGHICLDITPVFPASTACTDISELLVPGKLINTEAAEIHTGGSVANTGLALKTLGADVLLMGKVGSDRFGATVRDILASYGAGGLIVDDKADTSYSVVLAVPGIDRIFLHSPGANNSFTGADIPESDLNEAALFHFGYPPLMRKMYENDGAELTAILQRMKSLGIATSLDMAAVDPHSEAGAADWRAILKNVLPYVDFFVPSFEELCFMLDREKYERLSEQGGDMAALIDPERDAAPLAAECLKMGCAFALIKCGTAGMFYAAADAERMQLVGARLELDAGVWAGKSGAQPIFKAPRVLSATGAGDASIAAFLTALTLGYAPGKCVALAAAEGACAVTSYDALSGLKPLAELEEMISVKC